MKGRKVKQKMVVPPWPVPMGGIPMIWDDWGEGVRRATKRRSRWGAGLTGTLP
jgi:hypothetical protein